MYISGTPRPSSEVASLYSVASFVCNTLLMIDFSVGPC